MNNHSLLGNHKPSQEYYTPGYIWNKVYSTFDTKDIFDPCPIKGVNGLEISWKHNFVYTNPPTPAKLWAIKAIATIQEHKHVSIIFAAFSESVLFQVPELLTYPTVIVRNRIPWIDGKTMEPGKSPRNYNAFMCLSNKSSVITRFKDNFQDLGFVGKMVKI
ncbi:hypothetical protein NIES2100_05250 [Calothrix sp. NIES-2100]|uniref:hypothetical protein n=1 Tax=Calothrix sp. NIES-2100 TaxID=1954172 RepID=UPI000B6139AE|nr:hypothetical protein NIES2100_05250 [Calothrix sp. NIES-2100]